MYVGEKEKSVQDDETKDIPAAGVGLHPCGYVLDTVLVHIRQVSHCQDIIPGKVV